MIIGMTIWINLKSKMINVKSKSMDTLWNLTVYR